MKTLSLNGAWKLKRVKTGKVIDARVPGWTHTDLRRAGKIEDPYWRCNTADCQWISHEDWLYSREFDVPASLLKEPCVLLRCHGLDTLASVRVNGRKLAEVDNMYRLWEFDLKPFLKAGKNRIDILFKSVIPYINRKYREHPRYGWCEEDPIRIPHYCYVRKAPFQFGWDWSAALVGYGIWKDIEIAGFTARLKDIRVKQTHGRKAVQLDVSGTVENMGEGSYRISCVLRAGVSGVGQGQAKVQGGRFHLTLNVPKPRLWWPNGMGEQFLYGLTTELKDAAGRTVETDQKNIGLRTIRLVQQDDQWGQSFFFSVNGRPVWGRGANWVPADSFLTDITRERMFALIREAAAENMNILRVWGGGIYESDDFYDACDQYGVMVWQDFAFACSTYPASDRKYLANAKAEAEDNVRRIRHHASLCLFCGNNELEEGLVGPNPKREMTVKEYNALFCGILPDVVRRLAGEVPYIRTSGHTPGKRRDRSHAMRTDRGDTHLWFVLSGQAGAARGIDARALLKLKGTPLVVAQWNHVWNASIPPDKYHQRAIIPRFCSEWGRQSFPVMKTIRSFSRPADHNPLHPVMEYHQRGSNAWMLRDQNEKFMPPTRFPDWVLLSQIGQGEKFRWLVEHWRRSRPRCMGSLHWTFNDCWPAVEWSQVDYYLRRKASFYIFKRFYEPVMLSGEDDPKQGTCGLVVVNDRIQNVPGTVAWAVTDLSGKVLKRGMRRVKAKSCASTHVLKLELKEEYDRTVRIKRLLWMDWKGNDGSASSNLVWFVEPKWLELAKPKLLVSVHKTGPDTFAVLVRTDAPALWAWVNIDDGETDWSDNYFHLRPGTVKRLTARTRKPMSLAQFKQRLKTGSLMEMY